jgi:hypothetical protein
MTTAEKVLKAFWEHNESNRQLHVFALQEGGVKDKTWSAIVWHFPDQSTVTVTGHGKNYKAIAAPF